MFRKIRETYDGRLPNDAALGADLQEWGFYRKKVPVVLRSLRETFSLTGLDKDGSIGTPSDDSGNDAEDDAAGDEAPLMTTLAADAPKRAEAERKPTPNSSPETARKRSEFRIPIGHGDLAALNVPFPMTEAEWTMLNAVLTAMKDGIVSGGE